MNSRLRSPLAVATLGGVGYALAVFAWASATGVSFSGDAGSLLVGHAYAYGGMALTAGVPLYLLLRASLLSPALVTAWSLLDTVYQRLYVARPHDALASHLTVWPLFFGLLAAAALLEFGLRSGLDRVLGRFGPQSLV